MVAMLICTDDDDDNNVDNNNNNNDDDDEDGDKEDQGLTLFRSISEQEQNMLEETKN